MARRRGRRTPRRSPRAPDATYLVDGGAIPFFWAPLLADLAIKQWVEPRSTPLWFDPDEGGAPSEDARDLPAWTVTAGALALGAVIVADRGDPDRWDHTKGLAESLATTGLATGLLKIGFGRHRPDRDPMDDSDDGRRSFPSGHTSRSAAALTYVGLYAGAHLLEDEPAGWQVAAYAGLAAVQAAICVERVAHKRHHPGDTIAGTVLGAAISAAFFVWQERR